MPKRKQKELQSVEEFEGTLGEEISVSTEFDLPLSVLVAVLDWTPESTRRALDALRTADLVTRTADDEIAIALPNTVSENARVVERRLRDAIPEASVGITAHRTGDTVPDLLVRARAAARGTVPPTD
jgi:hypothetical protein